MEKLKGKVIFNSTVIGQVYYYQSGYRVLRQYKVSDVEAEIKRLSNAKKIVKEQLNTIVSQSINSVGETGNAILKVYLMMIDDVSYAEDVSNIIREKKINAESALMIIEDRLTSMFEAMDDKYMQDRSYDVRDIIRRLLLVLSGSESTVVLNEPAIIMAKELSVSDLMQMDKTKIRGIIVRYGSENSHMSIIAKNMGIPTMVGVYVDSAYHGMQAIIDGNTESFIINPDDATCANYNKIIKEESYKKHLLLELAKKPSITKDGQIVKTYANINGPEDMAAVIENGAEGIGLFRTEFLYLNRSALPTEEEQFNIYKEVINAASGKEVIIRTLDLGADKISEYAIDIKEHNPSMGYRGIRRSLLRTDIFKIQLRAIYRASVFGDVSIMFPMITSVSEIKKLKTIISEVKNNLAKDGIDYKDIKLGIMIETPASVMTADILAKEVDFFSIGTNDLTQYTLALDRANEGLEEYFDSHHEAILRMIDMVIKAAHDNNIKVGICGELASDITLTDWFVEHQIDELSLSPSLILPIREKIINF